MLNNLRADLRRYVKDKRDCPSFLAYLAQFIPIVLFHEGAISLIGYRLSAFFSGYRFNLLAYIISKIFFLLTGNYIHHKTKIGPGCKINHSATVIHALQIGRGFECSANVTIGQKIPYISPFPKIGDHVMVGAGARILNDLGNEVIVGANSVVIHPIENGRTVAGIPAKVVNNSENFMAYYKKLVSADENHEN